MTPEKLKEILDANGWRFGPLHEHTGVDWYAYKTLLSAVDCTSNEKPPGLILKPWNIERYGDAVLRSVEFVVTGEVGGDQWLQMKVYSVPMDQVIATIPRAFEILLAAWNAAAALNAPEAGRGGSNRTEQQSGVSTR